MTAATTAKTNAECLLCSAERITPWHHEDDDCWIADCMVCATPMIVWRTHGLPDPDVEAGLLSRLERWPPPDTAPRATGSTASVAASPTIGTPTPGRPADSSTREASSTVSTSYRRSERPSEGLCASCLTSRCPRTISRLPHRRCPRDLLPGELRSDGRGPGRLTSFARSGLDRWISSSRVWIATIRRFSWAGLSIQVGRRERRLDLRGDPRRRRGSAGRGSSPGRSAW